MFSVGLRTPLVAFPAQSESSLCVVAGSRDYEAHLTFESPVGVTATGTLARPWSFKYKTLWLHSRVIECKFSGGWGWGSLGDPRLLRALLGQQLRRVPTGPSAPRRPGIVGRLGRCPPACHPGRGLLCADYRGHFRAEVSVTCWGVQPGLSRGVTVPPCKQLTRRHESCCRERRFANVCSRPCFNALGYTLRGGNPGSCADTVLRNPLCTLRVPLSPRPLQRLLLISSSARLLCSAFL